jgi:hypothetical protein
LKPAADPTCTVAVLGGDVTSNPTTSPKAVNNGDVGATKNQVGQPVIPATCKYDANCGGTIVNGDYAQIKQRVGNSVTCP